MFYDENAETGNTLAVSLKRAVGRCDTAGQAPGSHPQAAHRNGRITLPRREGRSPSVTGPERALGLSLRQAEWYRGIFRLCFQRRFFIFEYITLKG